jgi:hypothetical protein
MYARAIEEAATALRRLHHDEWADLGLALVALTLALVASATYGPLAVPLFLGALYAGGSGLRASWRRWDLVDRLSGNPDAYSIDEIRACASRQATAERRRDYAASIRRSLKHRSPYDSRIESVAEELEALARELEDRTLAFDPACAVACRRLLNDPASSALLDPEASVENLRSSIRRIRLGLLARSVHDTRPRGSASRKEIMWNGSH